MIKKQVYIGALVTVTKFGLDKIVVYVSKQGNRKYISNKKIEVYYGRPMLYLGHVITRERRLKRVVDFGNVPTDYVHKHKFLIGKDFLDISFVSLEKEFDLNKHVTLYKHYNNHMENK